MLAVMVFMFLFNVSSSPLMFFSGGGSGDYFLLTFTSLGLFGGRRTLCEVVSIQVLLMFDA